MSENSRADLIERLESHMGRAEVPDLLRDCRLAAKAMRTDRYVIDTLTAVLASYEKLEADIILNGDWTDGPVRLTQEHHDSLLEIQEQRNAAMALVRGGPRRI